MTGLRPPEMHRFWARKVAIKVERLQCTEGRMAVLTVIFRGDSAPVRKDRPVSSCRRSLRCVTAGSAAGAGAGLTA
jgi:hypothetical protein